MALKLVLPAGPLENSTRGRGDPRRDFLATDGGRVVRFVRGLSVDTFATSARGCSVALEWQNLLFALIGVTLGTAVGVCPASVRR